MTADTQKKPPTVAPDKGLPETHTPKFTGTDNLRHLRKHLEKKGVSHGL